MCEGDHLGRPTSQRKTHTYIFLAASFSKLDCRKQPRFQKNSVHSLIQTVGSGTRTWTVCRKGEAAAIFIHTLCERARSTLQKS